MFRPFMRLSLSLLQDQGEPPSCEPAVKLLQLPNHILDIIFDHLNVLDRCSLALCSKQTLVYAHHNEHLDYIITSPPSPDSLHNFFERRLGRGWIPPHLRYCSDCGRFVSTDQHHWRHVSEKNTREHSGRISRLWRERREDGWLRYWIERWCEDGTDVDDAARALKMEDTTELVCPKCAILNPETNAWRTRRVEQRNQRHKGKSRLLSPGWRSPTEAVLVSRYKEVPAWI